MTYASTLIKVHSRSVGAVALTRVVVGTALAFSFAISGTAQVTTNPILTNTVLAKASPDECFAGIGNPYPPMTANGRCPKGAIPKVNQAYVWGLTQAGTKLWFGTAANVLCLVLGGYLGEVQPMQNQSWVCEFGSSQYAQTGTVPGAIGDWRPPKAYVYDTAVGKLKDVSPQNSTFTNTLGLRSAGSIGDTVFLAGPGLDGTSVNFFAFSSSASSYLGSCTTSQFNNIRQWRVINNVLYAGVGNTAGGGGLVRWNGTQSQPFDSTSATCGFAVVANLPGDAAYITAYGPNSDRIAVSTWPNPLGFPGATAGVYLSPQMTAAGFTSSDANTPWTPLWLPSFYEPDPVTALTYIGGAIAYWNGALYFGTMHVPGLSAIAHQRAYPNDPESSETVFANTYRAASIWRIQNADTTPAVQLLYGESVLPMFNRDTNTFQSTSTGYSPLYGSSGFGNVFNNYTWSAAVFQNRLFFGTMDWSYLAYEGLLGTAPQQDQQGQNQDVSQSVFGADLWRFDSSSRPAVAENVNGLGNYLNYGLRSMITSADGQNLFVGTANPMNLEAKGGWELRRLKLRNSQNSQ